MRISEQLAAPVEVEDLSATLSQKETISSKVAAMLRNLIWVGRLRPGDRIVEFKIARQLRVGQPTVREALIVLEHEGLVVRQPNRGCSVTRLSLEEIDHIYRLRIELEVLAAELAIENAAHWSADELAAILQRLRTAARGGDIEQWHRCDLQFHETIWRFSGNPFLEKALSQITVPFFAFAKLMFLQETPTDLMAQADEHEKIAQALCSGDKKRARRTVREVLCAFWRLWAARSRTSETEP